MKKSILLLIFSCFTFLYAANIKLSAIDTENLEINNYNNSSVASYVTADNVEISVMATDADDEEIKFGVQITNNGEEPFTFNENCITAYQGVFEKGNWTGITYYPASKYYSSKEYEYGAAVTMAAIGCGVLMLDLMLATACDDDYEPHPEPRPSHNARPKRPEPHSRPNRPKPRPAPAPRRPAQTTVHVTYDFGTLFSLISETKKDLNVLHNNLLYSSVVQPGETLNGIFYIDRNLGPDYKICFFVPSEGFVSYYFSRSDKQAIMHPWKDDKQDHHSVLMTLGLPQLNRFGFCYSYSGVPVGFYAGLGYEYPWGIKYNVVGQWDHNNYYPDHYNPGFNYDFERKGAVRREVTTLYGGINIKTVPHTWLMLGCGCDFMYNYYGGTEKVLNKDDDSVVHSTTNVWVQDRNVNVYCSPQVGINLIFNVLDVGATFSYRIGDGPQFDLMMGFAL